MAVQEVSAEAARPRIDSAHFDFDTTASVQPSLEVGAAAIRLQPRARAALEVAVATRAPGLHVFASGSPHLGKWETVWAVLSQAARGLPRADDWAYVFDEDAPDRPVPLRLPAGEAPRFAKAVRDAVDVMKREVPRVVRSGRFRKRHLDLEEQARQEEERLLAALKEKLRALSFDVRREEGQLEATPLIAGRPMRRSQEKLAPKQRRAIEAHLPRVSDLVEETNRSFARAAASFDARHAEIDRQAAEEVATRALESVRRDFAHSPEAQVHLQRLGAALVKHYALFLRPPAEAGPQQPKSDPFLRFQVHVLMTHDGEAGAPVVRESNPSLSAPSAPSRRTWSSASSPPISPTCTRARCIAPTAASSSSPRGRWSPRTKCGRLSSVPRHPAGDAGGRRRNRPVGAGDAPRAGAALVHRRPHG